MDQGQRSLFLMREMKMCCLFSKEECNFDLMSRFCLLTAVVTVACLIWLIKHEINSYKMLILFLAVLHFHIYTLARFVKSNDQNKFKKLNYPLEIYLFTFRFKYKRAK